jgi:hemoglobin-like flavoprotein
MLGAPPGDVEPMAEPAFAKAALIEASLEALAERAGDPTPLVYAKLFAAYPAYQAHFWRDKDGAIKGEMLARVFEALLDFIGERRYADHMINTELVTHEGYDVDREVFATFFGHVAQTVQDVLGEDWTAELAAAWSALLEEIDVYVQATPRSDVSNPVSAKLRAEFEAAWTSA